MKQVTREASASDSNAGWLLGRPRLLSYTLAALAVGLALLLKLLLGPLIEEESPFLLFFGAVLIGAYFGGLGPGLLATVLAALASDYFFISSNYSFLNNDAGQNLRLVLFVLEGALISSLVTTMHSARYRADASARQARGDQQSLRESEARYRLLVESVKDYTLFMIDMDGRVTGWNKGAERIFGYREEEIIGRHFSLFFTPEDVQRGAPERELDEAVVEDRGEDERWYVRKDGTRFFASGFVKLVQDDDGNLCGFTKIARDITERKRSEDALRFVVEASTVLASSLDYRTTLAAVADLTVPYLADWCAVNILEEDGSLGRLAVCHEDPEKVALARELQERYPPDPEAPYGVHQVMRTGRSELISEIPEPLVEDAARDEEHREMLRKLGLKSYMVVPLVARERTLGAITLVYAESGRRYGDAELELAEDLARRAAVAVDNARLYDEAQKEISERKQAEEALQMSETRFRTMIEQSPLSIQILSPDGRTLQVNRAWEELWGVTLDDIVGYNLLEDQQLMDKGIAPYIQRGFAGEPTLVPPTVYDPDETIADLTRHEDPRRCVRAFIYPVKNEAGNIREVVLMHEDVTERNRVEEALRSSEERYRVVAETASDAIIMIDEDSQILFVNSAVEKIFGYTSAEILGERLTMLMPEHLRSTHQASLKRYADTGRKCLSWEALQLPGLHKSGTEVPLEVSFGEFVKEGRRLFTGFISDITERKKAEAQASFLTDLSQTLQQLTDPDEVMATAARLLGEHLAANRCAYAEVEADEDHFHIIDDYTSGVSSIVGRFSMSQFGSEALRLMRANKPYVVADAEEDERVGAADLATYRQTQIRAVVCVPLHKAGRFVAGMAVHQKIPRRWSREEVELVMTVSNRCWESIERVRAVRSLRESEEWLRTLADNISQLAWMADEKGWIFWYNKRWFDYTGTTMEEMQGWGWRKVHHPDHIDRVVERVQWSWDTGELWEDTFPLRGKDGTYRWFLSRALPIRDEAGQIMRWFGTNTDVTEQRKAEEEARRLNEELEQRVEHRTMQLQEANRELESFSYSVSHDLRAPIRHISGFAEILQKRAASSLDETNLRYLNTIRESTERAGTLVDDLLSFSRMGRAGMYHTVVDMDQLVRMTASDLRFETAGRNIAWEFGELPEVRGDPSMLRLVVQNLLSNAVKYTSTRDRVVIEVGSTSDENETVFSVRDNGVGFDMRYVDKLFGVFQRLHGKEEFEGTGIGLATVRRIVHRHSGRVWAESSVGEGAAFFFSLPRLTEESNEQSW